MLHNLGGTAESGMVKMTRMDGRKKWDRGKNVGVITPHEDKNTNVELPPVQG